MGNGGNTVRFDEVTIGGTVNFHGGSGGDSVDWGPAATALNGALQFIFGSGDDTFTVENSNFKSLYADGGFGTNTLITTVPISSPTTFKNFT
jgi:hypothetical protein